MQHAEQFSLDALTPNGRAEVTQLRRLLFELSRAFGQYPLRGGPLGLQCGHQRICWRRGRVYSIAQSRLRLNGQAGGHRRQIGSNLKPLESRGSVTKLRQTNFAVWKTFVGAFDDQ